MCRFISLELSSTGTNPQCHSLSAHGRARTRARARARLFEEPLDQLGHRRDHSNKCGFSSARDVRQKAVSYDQHIEAGRAFESRASGYLEVAHPIGDRAFAIAFGNVERNRRARLLEVPQNTRSTSSWFLVGEWHPPRLRRRSRVGKRRAFRDRTLARSFDRSVCWVALIEHEHEHEYEYDRFRECFQAPPAK